MIPSKYPISAYSIVYAQQLIEYYIIIRRVHMHNINISVLFCSVVADTNTAGVLRIGDGLKRIFKHNNISIL